MTTQWPSQIEDIVETLVVQHPALRIVVDDAIDTYGGLAGTGVMFWLRLWARDLVLTDPAAVKFVFDDLGAALLAGDPTAQNAIRVGFIEGLEHPRSDAERALVALLPSVLRAEVETLRTAQPWIHYSAAGSQALYIAGPAHRSHGATIEEQAWWEALADWVVDEVIAGNHEGPSQALLEDIDKELARSESRGRQYILRWFIPRLIASAASTDVRRVLPPHLFAASEGNAS